MKELPDDFKAGVYCNAKMLRKPCSVCQEYNDRTIAEVYFKNISCELFAQYTRSCKYLKLKESEQLKYGKSVKGMVYDVAGRVYVFYICRECCNKIGIKLYDNQEEIEDIMKDLCSSSVDFGFHEYFDGDDPDVF